jgi:carboxypeptidase D
MQDYNYQDFGSLAVTLEVSCCKHPSVSELPTFWEQNRDAMIKFLLQFNNGMFCG